MSDLPQDSGDLSNSDPGPEPKSPNLILIYILLAAGILLALGVAALIVRPFYLRR